MCFIRWMASMNISEPHISAEKTRCTVTSVRPNLMLLWWVMTNPVSDSCAPRGTITTWQHVFQTDMCNEASSRCSDAAAEEVWFWLQLHVVCQKQPGRGCSLLPANPRGTVCILFCSILSQHMHLPTAHPVLSLWWSESVVWAVCVRGSLWWS